MAVLRHVEVSYAFEGRNSLMSGVNVRVAARRSVVDAHAERRRRRQELEDQVAGLAIEVNVALASGRAALGKAELDAGRALNKMFELGMTMVEVIDWCALEITSREISRLRRIADDAAATAEVEVKS